MKSIFQGLEKLRQLPDAIFLLDVATDKEVLKEAPVLRLGDILKKEMKVKGLTISHLSKECGISRTTIHNWIQGIGPSASNIPSLVKLCLYFNVSLEYLLFGKEFSIPFNNDEDIVFRGKYKDLEGLCSILIKKESIIKKN